MKTITILLMLLAGRAFALDPACTTTPNLGMARCPADSTDWYESYTDQIDELDALSRTAKGTFTIQGNGLLFPAGAISDSTIYGQDIAQSTITPNKINAGASDGYVLTADTALGYAKWAAASAAGNVSRSSSSADQTTTSTVYIGITGSTSTITVSQNSRILLSWFSQFSIDATTSFENELMQGGTALNLMGGGRSTYCSATAGFIRNCDNEHLSDQLAAGTYTFSAMAKTGSGTATIYGWSLRLTEIKQ